MPKKNPEPIIKKDEDFTVVAIDSPTLDYIFPSIDKINKIINDNNVILGNEKNSDFWLINDLYDKIILAHGNVTDNRKKTLSPEEEKESLELVKQIQPLLRKYGIDIECVGGTGANKLHTTKAIFGGQVNAKLVGAVGNDEFGEIIKKSLAASGIELVDNGDSTQKSRVSIIITPKNEKDRIIGKCSSDDPQIFKNENSVAIISNLASLVYVESKLESYLGKAGFGSFISSLDQKGKVIFFAPPTDLNQYKMEGNAVFIKAGFKSDIITMNEAEACALCGIEIPKDYKFSGLDDPLIQKASEYIEGALKDKDHIKFNNQHVFITAGEHGSIAIHKDYGIIKEPACKLDQNQFENTVGAGDAFASTVCCLMMINNMQGKTNDENAVREVMQAASRVSALVISQLSAQADPECIIDAVLDKIPTAGKVKNINKTFLEQWHQKA